MWFSEIRIKRRLFRPEPRSPPPTVIIYQVYGNNNNNNNNNSVPTYILRAIVFLYIYIYYILQVYNNIILDRTPVCLPIYNGGGGTCARACACACVNNTHPMRIPLFGYDPAGHRHFAVTSRPFRTCSRSLWLTLFFHISCLNCFYKLCKIRIYKL